MTQPKPRLADLILSGADATVLMRRDGTQTVTYALTDTVDVTLSGHAALLPPAPKSGSAQSPSILNHYDLVFTNAPSLASALDGLLRVVTGRADLLPALPPELAALADIHLVGGSLTVLSSGPPGGAVTKSRVLHFDLTFRLGADDRPFWPLLAEAGIALSAPLLTLDVALPYDATAGGGTDGRRIDLHLAETITLTDKLPGSFEVRLWVPLAGGQSPRLSVALLAGATPTTLRDLLCLIPGFQPSHTAMLDLGIAELQVTGTLGGPDLSFEVTLAATTLPLADSITLQALSLSLTKGALGLMGTVDCRLVAHGFTLDLTAGYASQGGWSFTGAVDLGSGVTIADLVMKIAPGTACPAALKDLSITAASANYDTGDGSFGLTVDSTLTLGGVPCPLTLSLTHAKDASTGQTAFSIGGVLTLALPTMDDALVFELAFDKGGDGSLFAGAFSADPPLTLTLADLAGLVGADTSGLPDLSLAISDAILLQQGAARFFDLTVQGGVDLTALVPPGLPLTFGSGKLALTLAASYGTGSSPAATKALIAAGNALLATVRPDAPQVPADVTPTGLGLDFRILVDGQPITLSFAPGAPGTSPPAPPTTAPAAGQPPAPGHWISLQRHFGPVYLDRLGLTPAKGGIGVDLAGRLDFGPVGLSLINLGATVPMPPRLGGLTDVHLDGFGLDFHQGGVSLSGAFLKGGTAASPSYDGAASLQVGGIGLSLLGGFAKTAQGDASFFLFGVLDAPLGGPPFFVVQGLAVGFGLNRALALPKITDVPGFSFLTEMHPVPGAATDTASRLARVEGDVPITQDAVFLCAGVHFTSFGMIDTVALLALQIGQTVEIDAMAVSSASVPSTIGATATPPSRLASVTVASMARLNLTEGSLLAQAQLMPGSYLLSPDCHLTGGLAMAAWAKGPHAGDFVYSVGGYHPAFAVPAHYPKGLPRLGFSWQMTSSLSLTGGLYYALTPHALMAGGSLSAHFQSGSLTAWFDCGADFLLNFHPFHYDATAHVSIGAALTIHCFGTHHIQIEAAADIHLWGPEPAGHAHVRVKVLCIHVSFDVDFGNSAALALPIGLDAFETAFLPKRDTWLSITAEAGVLGDMAPSRDGVKRWRGASKGFAFSASSALPARGGGATPPLPQGKLSTGMTLAAGDPAPRLSIRPAGRDGFDLPVPVVTVVKTGGNGLLAETAFGVTPVLHNVPAALWGKPQMAGAYLIPPELNEKDRTLPALAGWRFAANDPKPADTPWHPASDFAFDTGTAAAPVIAFGTAPSALTLDAAALLAVLPPIAVLDA
jgi:hypothetical protein